VAATEVAVATKVEAATEVVVATEVVAATKVEVATTVVATVSKTIMGKNITPQVDNTLKRLQIYQSIMLQYKKTFMLSMKKLPKEQMKRTMHL
jgi:GMP synthase PP-ATPase subunit